MITITGTNTIQCQKPKRLSMTSDQVGQWLLILCPLAIRHIMMNVIAGLAIAETVRVLDAGNLLDRLEVAWHLWGKPEMMATELVSDELRMIWTLNA